MWICWYLSVMARVLDCCGKEEVTLEHKAQHPQVSQFSNPQPMNLEDGQNDQIQSSTKSAAIQPRSGQESLG